jgi:nitroreductase
VKKLFLSLLLCGLVLAAGAQDNNPGLKSITTHYAARNFTAGTIPRADIELILKAGINAPSANNRQPWRFTVVQNQNLAKRVISNITDGNILIVISAEGDGKTNGGAILDCALACESMYLAAQALGYGSRIYTGPIDAVNRNLKADLALPAGHNAVVLVRVGRIAPGTDAVSAASSRKNSGDLVSWK